MILASTLGKVKQHEAESEATTCTEHKDHNRQDYCEILSKGGSCLNGQESGYSVATHQMDQETFRDRNTKLCRVIFFRPAPDAMRLVVA